MNYLKHKSIQELEYELDVAKVTLDHAASICNANPSSEVEFKQHFLLRIQQIKALLKEKVKSQESNGK